MIQLASIERNTLAWHCQRNLWRAKRDLPGAVRLAVRPNPLSYGVDGLRGALNGGFAFGVATDKNRKS